LAYAYFLESTQNRYDEAEELYLRVLEENPNDLFACYRYSNFLNTARGLHNAASLLWQRYKILERNAVTDSAGVDEMKRREI
jgi:DNA phosphorothioation-dependent restriction protein DptG